MKNEKERKMMNDDLPYAMIMGILVRLQSKSLHRFRSLSKSWCSVLSPNFIRCLDKNNRKLFLVFPEYYSTLDCYEATFDADADATSEVRYEYPFKDSASFLTIPMTLLFAKPTIYGSCDSWLLLGDRSRKMWLLNPSTRDYKEFRCYDQYGFHPALFGICYDSSQNEYKVVSVMKDYLTSLESDYCILSTAKTFTVFSFKTNSWINHRVFPYDIDLFACDGVSVNGAPHWVGYNNSIQSMVILCFLVKDEKFIEVPKPSIDNGIVWIAAMGGNLFAYSPSDGAVNVWKMKEYGVEESWIQVFRIIQPVSWKQNEFPRPLAFSKKGELILLSLCGTEIILYNQKENKLKTLVKFEKGKLYYYDYASFVDSFAGISSD